MFFVKVNLGNRKMQQNGISCMYIDVAYVVTICHANQTATSNFIQLYYPINLPHSTQMKKRTTLYQGKMRINLDLGNLGSNHRHSNGRCISTIYFDQIINDKASHKTRSKLIWAFCILDYMLECPVVHSYTLNITSYLKFYASEERTIILFIHTIIP